MKLWSAWTVSWEQSLRHRLEQDSRSFVVLTGFLPKAAGEGWEQSMLNEESLWGIKTWFCKFQLTWRINSLENFCEKKWQLIETERMVVIPWEWAMINQRKWFSWALPTPWPEGSVQGDLVAAYFSYISHCRKKELGGACFTSFPKMSIFTEYIL